MSFARSLGKGIFAAADLVTATPQNPRILIYHQVGTHHGHQMEVMLDAFSRQMEWLAANRTVTDLPSALSAWTTTAASQLVVLTFDDGYRDLYTTAFPILEEHRFPFVLYLSTGMIGNAARAGEDPPLDWPEIEEMLESGLMTLGSHTHSHPDLRMISASEIEEELEKSDAIVQGRLGARPEHFAYPYGYWSRDADPIVRRRYRTATLGGTPRHPANLDPHLVNRYPVQLSDGFGFFKARLRRGLKLEEAVRRRLKGYRGP